MGVLALIKDVNGMTGLQGKFNDFATDIILNVGETGLFFKLEPKKVDKDHAFYSSHARKLMMKSWSNFTEVSISLD